MLFPTSEFALFFIGVFALGWALNNHRVAWKWFMLLASYFFYAFWSWRFLLLIIASTIVNHTAACAIEKAGPRARRGWLAGALVFNLGFLGFFKYYGFLAENVDALCVKIGMPMLLPLADIVLPVAISFFTFSAISYLMDVYRHGIPPAKSIMDFAVYLAFFPHLVAGPIVRASLLVPQIAAPAATARIDVGRAMTLILGGLAKKIIIANTLSQHIADPVFSDPSSYGALDALFGLYGYAIQIYCDFSAYSDIATGIALLLGVRFQANFNAPYFATSLQSFWRRWHVSLSAWLRDYLFIPLGGSRGSVAMTCRNLILTFLIGGLWHGAGWTFIVWGALHGIFLTCGRLWESRKNPAAQQKIGPAGRLLRMFFTFHLVCITWIFFRSQSFDDAWEMLRAFGRWSTPPTLVTPFVVVMLTIGFLSQWLDNARAEKLWDRINKIPWYAQGALAAVTLTIILALGPKGVAPFIYFQF